MVTSALRRHPGLLVVLAAIGAAAIVGTAVVLVAPDAGIEAGAPPAPEPVPEPDTTSEPDPEPEPEPDPDPVRGEIVATDVVDVSVHGTELFGDRMPQEAPVAVDEDAVAAFVTAIAGWLDAELSALQVDAVEDDTTPPDARAEGPAGAATVADRDGPLAASGLVGPDRLVASATYTVEVAVRGAPEWARVDVEVVARDGRRGTLALVVVPGGPLTVVAGELDGTDT